MNRVNEFIVLSSKNQVCSFKVNLISMPKLSQCESQNLKIKVYKLKSLNLLNNQQKKGMETSQHMSQTSQLKKEKTKEDYSRNVKKLKFKLQKISTEIQSYQKKIQKIQNTSNDQIIAMKISKFCKQRKFTPQMLFRFADTKCVNLISRMQFRNALISVGLKLSQQEFTRLEYLLDEDIKGDISSLEYSKYLHAFGLKNQHNPDDPFVKQTLKDVNFNKLLQIAKDDSKKAKRKGDLKNLLAYEQFLQYCHSHNPQLKDKQLAKIFKLLSVDDRIDLDDFIEYLENLRKENERINKKNKEKEKILEEEKTKPKNDIHLIEQEQQKIDILTLKGKLMAVLRQHPSKQQTFHSSEFKRIEKTYKEKLQKGVIANLFRQMDTKLVGSIGYNQIIAYYAENQTYIPNNDILVKYTFILMGRKMLSLGQIPEAVVATFIKEQTHITSQQFVKMCGIEFSLKDQLAKCLYEILLRCPGQKIKENCVNTSLLISLMKVNRRGMKNNIRPVIDDKYKQFLYKKHYQTICTNGIIAYKICESIVSQLAQSTEGYQKWDDFEFGPSVQDQNGLDSIGRNISNPNIKWHRASNLNMKDFYIPSNKQEKIFSLSSMCQNDLFYKSLQTLIKQNPKCLNRQSGQIVKNGKKVQEQELVKLFQGLHPLVFCRYEERGIYVMQFYVKGKWIYVIVDDKIPCGLDDQPLFAKTAGAACSYISLIQKAYAKLKGSYEKIYESSNYSQYMYELSSFLVYTTNINDSVDKNQQNKLWEKMLRQASIQQRKKELEKDRLNKLSSTRLYLANMAFSDKKARISGGKYSNSGLQTNTPIQIFFSTEIKDLATNTNAQQAQALNHRLTLLNNPHVFQLEEKWNSSWYPYSALFKAHEALLKAEVNKWDNENQSEDKIYKNGKLSALVLDLQTMKSMFNSIVGMMNFRFDDNAVLLRKEVEFQIKFSLLYKVYSIDKNKQSKVIIVLNRIRAPEDARIIITMKSSSQSTTKNNSPEEDQKKISEQYIVRGQFGCVCFQIPQTEHDILIKVDKFQPNQQYIYQLSFYFDSPKYSLKERDRHLLFRKVSPYEERSKLDFDYLTEDQKKYFYEHYFLNANRKGFLCC